GGAEFIFHRFVRRNLFTGMRLADVDEEKFDVIAAELVIKAIQSADRAQRHGASSGTEGEHDILVLLEITQCELIALDGTEREVGCDVAGLRATGFNEIF